jgi:hypothetical protein
MYSVAKINGSLIFASKDRIFLIVMIIPVITIVATHCVYGQQKILEIPAKKVQTMIQAFVYLNIDRIALNNFLKKLRNK